MANVNLSKERLKRLSKQVPDSCGKRQASERFSVKETFSGVKTLSNIFMEIKDMSKARLHKKRQKKEMADFLGDITSFLFILASLFIGIYFIYFVCKNGL